jgi:hypothetical protein
MAKVGRMVIDAKVGAYCQIALDSGEKILLNHDRGDLKGGTLTVTEVRWWGLGSGETLFICRLDTAEGAATLRRLTGEAPAGTPEATPLVALLEHLKPCRSIADARTTLSALAGGTA